MLNLWEVNAKTLQEKGKVKWTQCVFSANIVFAFTMKILLLTIIITDKSKLLGKSLFIGGFIILHNEKEPVIQSSLKEDVTSVLGMLVDLDSFLDWS